MTHAEHATLIEITESAKDEVHTMADAVRTGSFPTAYAQMEAFAAMGKQAEAVLRLMEASQAIKPKA